MSNSMRFVVVMLLVVVCVFVFYGTQIAQSQTLSAPLDEAFRFLNQTMDVGHERFWIFNDAGTAENHFSFKAILPDGNAGVSMDECWNREPYSGATCIRCRFRVGGVNWGGFFFQNGIFYDVKSEIEQNWGAYPNAGLDWTGATELTFWARGSQGGERVEFFTGGAGWSGNSPTEPYPDSFPRVSSGLVALTKVWTKYTLDLTGQDVSYVIGGFGWETSAAVNENRNISFFIDEISINRPRPDDLRFLRSFETLPTLTDSVDVAMRNVAYTYDNALALLAYLARGDADDLRRARILADSFVYAANHDRFHNDGRLRNAYSGGDLMVPPGWEPNGRIGTVRAPGYWLCSDNSWVEVESGLSSNMGNIAWVMIALAAAGQQFNTSDYLDAAIGLGEWVETNCRDERGAGGYSAGIRETAEDQFALKYKSTEHNLDVNVAFWRLYAITKDAVWRERALHAKSFVESMWDEREGKFHTGTDNSGITINEEVVPLDVQALSILTLRNEESLYIRALKYAELHHRVNNGFDFNRDKDGIWYEGTAQMAAAYQQVGQQEKANDLFVLIEAAQTSTGSIPSASIDELTTGFGGYYYKRGHVGATAWYVLAKLGTNPFWVMEPEMSEVKRGALY